ncbi:hypothetical protein IE81DRAFT_369508 [Ceraceosorus guamensis]|uniref:Uncharacterized protein n=1 Tax=Ceraceosorus guamensis TaxID=1522189 RepID=A0A316VMU4_9BASI|nr:hypothetical protein IE81DRAFT_369508 [Ceraceosorus guamensis]PWN38886.1 hypothetical protein IE81DRAFT_369508 [Ceraceosorus guamensis]
MRINYLLLATAALMLLATSVQSAADAEGSGNHASRGDQGSGRIPPKWAKQIPPIRGSAPSRPPGKGNGASSGSIVTPPPSPPRRVKARPPPRVYWITQRPARWTDAQVTRTWVVACKSAGGRASVYDVAPIKVECVDENGFSKADMVVKALLAARPYQWTFAPH